MQELTIIITAGGVGKRMGTEVPKQFILLNSKPILLHTLERFYSLFPDAQYIITLPDGFIEDWKKLCLDAGSTIDHQTITGGKERFDSVKNALALASGKNIMIHDGVRPLVSHSTLTNGLEALKEFNSAIPVIAPNESIREIKGDETKSVNRDNYLLVQTPQCFRAAIIKNAYNLPFQNAFTDDASVVEFGGEKIHVFEGNKENIKITNPSDLAYAEFLLKMDKNSYSSTD